MKNNLSKTAFTLIELIVSALLVIIVLLGIFSINTVLSNNNQDYGQRYLVNSETQITLNHILNNAALAVGSAVPNDGGILLGASCPGAGANTLGCSDPVNNPNTFCIHQAGGNNSQNLIGSANDIWLCYTWSGNQINWCAENYTGSVMNPGTIPDPRGASSCNFAQAGGTLVVGRTVTYLGTANTGFALQVPPPTFTSNGAQLLFSITLQNCLNNSAATCNGSAAGVSSDPANNPEVVVSGSVSPSQESM